MYFPGLEVVVSQSANWERDQGFNVSRNLLEAHRRTEVLFACNDLMVLGMMEAITATGKTGRIKVIGFDVLEWGREAIQEGTMEASVARHPEAMADSLLKALCGSSRVKI